MKSTFRIVFAALAFVMLFPSSIFADEQADKIQALEKRVESPKLGPTLSANSWGALQLVTRYSVLDIDNDAFPTFANPATSASQANAWGVGLNWYLNRNVRAAVNFNHTDFKGGQNGSVTAQDENVFLTRLQLAF